MTLIQGLENLLAYSLQLGLVVAVAGLFPFLLRFREPRPLLIYWQALLLAALLLPLLQPWRQEVVVVPSAAPALVAPVPATTVAPATAGRRFPFAEAAAAVLVGGVLLRLAWLLAGLIRLRTYRRRARLLKPVPAAVELMCRRLVVRPAFLVSPHVSGPATFGFLRQVVLFHEGFEELDERSQEALACHELLHLRRRDWLWTVFEELVRVVLWFHPAVWWLVERIRMAREQVVDREAVALTRSRPAYLEALLNVAARRLPERPVPAPLFLSERQLVRRVALMLEEVSMSKTRFTVSLSAMVLAGLAGTVVAVQAFPLSARVEVRSAVEPEEVHPAVEAQAVEGGAAERGRGLLRVEGDVQMSKLLHRVEPVYPEPAFRARVSGRVVLEATLDEAGSVVGLQPLRGHPLLNAAALEAVRQWRYEPTYVRGEPVPVITTVELVFQPGGAARLDLQVDRPETAREEANRLEGVGLGRAPIRVGGNVQESKLVHRVEPEYPELAKRARIQGIVRLNVTVDAQGEVVDVQVIRGHPMLNPAAVAAVRQWRYSPTYLEGEPVPVVATVSIMFRPEGTDGPEGVGESPALLLRMDASGTVWEGPRRLDGADLLDRVRAAGGGSILLLAHPEVPDLILKETRQLLEQTSGQIIELRRR